MAEYPGPDQHKGNALYEAIADRNFLPQTAEAEAKIIPDLLTTRPYPLIHQTRPSVAIAALVNGLHSSASAKEAGEHILDSDAWQGDRAISVTDLEGFIEEHGLDPTAPANPHDQTTHTEPVKPSPQEEIRAAAEIALGMREATDVEHKIGMGFWNKGGVCLLINPALERHYGGTSIYTDRNQAREDLIGIGHEGTDQVRYGGGFPGEAVVVDRVVPQDIHGVLLTSDFVDGDIIGTFNQKTSLFDTTTPENFADTFHDEVNLLKAFDLLDPDMKQELAYIREHDRLTMGLRAALSSDVSAADQLREHPEKPSDDFFGEPPTDEEWAEYKRTVFSAEAAQQAELASILNDSELSQYKANLLDAFRSKLEPRLQEANISTYSELITLVAKTEGFPVYDTTGRAVWPNKQVGLQPNVS